MFSFLSKTLLGTINVDDTLLCDIIVASDYFGFIEITEFYCKYLCEKLNELNAIGILRWIIVFIFYDFFSSIFRYIYIAERDRIIKARGSVINQRVNGSLAVSRALGDFEYKTNGDMGQTEQLVSPEPDVLSIERDPKDEFVVLACDGIWDVMSNEDIRDFVRDRLRTTDKLDEISNSVLDTCLNKVSFKYYIYNHL